MDFRAHVRRAWMIGGLILIALVAVPVMFIPEARGAGDALVLTGLLLGGGLIFLGGIARPLHRWMWFRLLRPWALGAQLRSDALVAPVVGRGLQRWLHVTPEGLSRDDRQ
jgi:hypothetical protein